MTSDCFAYLPRTTVFSRRMQRQHLQRKLVHLQRDTNVFGNQLRGTA